jgi:acylphosphatase
MRAERPRRVGADGTNAIVYETRGYNSRPVIVARRFLIDGRVQGVGFRWFAVEQARLEGVNGFVRNLPDGRVEAIVEGDADSVDRVERALRRGPRGSRVERFEAERSEPAGYHVFEIRH